MERITGLRKTDFVLNIGSGKALLSLQWNRLHWAIEPICTERGKWYKPPESAQESASMAKEAPVTAGSYIFDDHNIRWDKLGDLQHFVFAVLDVDAPRKVVDFIIKFDPNEQIILHRHLALTNTLVMQGEHRLYEPNGALKEVRAVGSYTSSLPGEPHREGGGDQEAVVLYSVRGKDGVLFELLNDDLSISGTLSMADFVQAFEDQKRHR
jgi:hypothetical protein